MITSENRAAILKVFLTNDYDREKQVFSPANATAYIWNLFNGGYNFSYTDWQNIFNEILRLAMEDKNIIDTISHLKGIKDREPEVMALKSEVGLLMERLRDVHIPKGKIKKVERISEFDKAMLANKIKNSNE